MRSIFYSFIDSAAFFASSSHSSFCGCPSCPLTQNARILCGALACRYSRQSSGFFTSLKFFFIQPKIQPFMLFTTYELSEYSSTSHGNFNAFSPIITAVSSILLFVVKLSPPLFFSLCSPYSKINAQPPRPGLFRQLPSLKSLTHFIIFFHDLWRD